MSEAIVEAGGIGVTESVFGQLKKIIADVGDGKMLRVAVLGGGCSGFQYKFDLAETPDDDDVVIEHGGLTVLIDPISQPFLEGAVIDYKDALIGSHFAVENPNATASCGCGTSFSI